MHWMDMERLRIAALDETVSDRDVRQAVLIILGELDGQATDGATAIVEAMVTR